MHDAWIGPNAVFVNDPHPPLALDMKGPVIEPFAKVGANVTVLDHVTIGKNALIGAGAVVIKDIPANSVVVGNPAKIIKNINDIPEYKL
jgi:acetyltransferase-like isoleucine patch superfamily enzyme